MKSTLKILYICFTLTSVASLIILAIGAGVGSAEIMLTAGFIMMVCGVIALAISCTIGATESP